MQYTLLCNSTIVYACGASVRPFQAMHCNFTVICTSCSDNKVILYYLSLSFR